MRISSACSSSIERSRNSEHAISSGPLCRGIVLCWSFLLVSIEAHIIFLYFQHLCAWVIARLRHCFSTESLLASCSTFFFVHAWLAYQWLHLGKLVLSLGGGAYTANIVKLPHFSLLVGTAFVTFH
jgi:hypothetical protein